MTDLDLDALEATARAATPGPWEADREYHTCYLNDEADCEYPDSPVTERTEWRAGVDGALYDTVHHVHASYDSHLIAPDVAGNYDYEDGGIIHTEDAKYIAAFDPPTTLALIARLREAESAIDAVSDYADDAVHVKGIQTRLRQIIARYKTTKTEGNGQ